MDFLAVVAMAVVLATVILAQSDRRIPGPPGYQGFGFGPPPLEQVTLPSRGIGSGTDIYDISGSSGGARLRSPPRGGRMGRQGSRGISGRSGGVRVPPSSGGDFTSVGPDRGPVGRSSRERIGERRDARTGRETGFMMTRTSDGQEGYLGALGGREGMPFMGGIGPNDIFSDGGLSLGLQDGIGTGSAQAFYERRMTGREDIAPDGYRPAGSPNPNDRRPQDRMRSPSGRMREFPGELGMVSPGEFRVRSPGRRVSTRISERRQSSRAELVPPGSIGTDFRIGLEGESLGREFTRGIDVGPGYPDRVGTVRGGMESARQGMTGGRGDRTASDRRRDIAGRGRMDMVSMGGGRIAGERDRGGRWRGDRERGDSGQSDRFGLRRDRRRSDRSGSGMDRARGEVATERTRSSSGFRVPVETGIRDRGSRRPPW